MSEDRGTGGLKAVRLAAVGDLMTGDTRISVGYGFGSRYREGLGRIAEGIRPILSGAEIVLGNLECALSLAGYRADRWQASQMRGWPSFAGALRSAGFTHLSVANNHSNQHGDPAFQDTVELLEETGIAVCGLRGEDGWCARPVITDCQGVTVAILAYSLRPRQYGGHPPPYAEGNEGSIVADVGRVRGACQRIVVALHWGEEYGQLPSESEVSLGRTLVDAGVDLVVGHHPHVLRPVEVYRSGVIAYSLGNFLADMTWMDEFMDSVVLRCDLNNGPESLELVPLRIGDDFMPRRTESMGELRPVRDLRGLSVAEYRQQTERTEGAQRIRSYVHALRNLRRYQPSILRQLIWTTLRNKVG